MDARIHMPQPLTLLSRLARHFNVLAIIAATMMVGVVASAWHLIRNDQDRQLIAEMRGNAETVTAHLEAHIQTRLAIGLQLRDHWQEGHTYKEQEFRRLAHTTLSRFPDFQAINWVDPQGIIKWVTPLKGNEAARELNLRELAVPGSTLRDAETSGNIRVSPPIHLVQGDLGIVAYIPLRIDGAPAGVVNLVLRIKPLMDAVLPKDHGRRFGLHITDAENVVYHSMDTSAPPRYGTERSIRVGNRTWRISMSPSALALQRNGSFVDEMVLVVGLVFSAMISWLVRLVMMRQFSLRESEARFRDIATVSSDWFWEMDADLRFTYISDRYEEITGARIADRLGTLRWDPIEENELASKFWTDHMADLAAHRPFRNFEYAVDIGFEKKLYSRISGVPRFDVSGTFLGYRGSSTNITDQIFAARALAGADRKLREILDKTPVAIAIVDHPANADDPMPGRCVFVNDAMATMFGANSKEELLGQGSADTWVDIDEMRHLEMTFRLGKCLAGFECRRRRHDGTVVWASISSLPIQFDGKDCTMLWIFNIDETKRMQLALQESEARLRAVFDHTPVGMNLKDLEGRYLWVNKPFVDWLGHSHDDIVGKRAHDFLGPSEELDRIIAAEMEVLRTGMPEESEIRLAGPDGRVFNQILIKFPVKAPDGDIYGLGTVALDISDRKRMLAALEAAKVQAETANRAKSEFLAHMSHDLRTPLNAILGFSEMMAQKIFGPLGDPHYEQYADLIHQSGRRLVTMVNDILDLSRIESGEYTLTEEVLDMRAVFESSCQRCATFNAAGRFSALTIDVVENAPRLFADERAVSQIADNLLTNAIKYGGSEAAIQLRWSVEAEGQGQFQIADSGPGIAPAELERISQPFVRGGRENSAISQFANKVDGVGLGLSIVSRLAELHGARLHIDSTLGEGTTVTVMFPASRVHGA